MATRSPAFEPDWCPERKECLELVGAPIGMYHCTHCGEMILAGVDPAPLCAYAPPNLNDFIYEETG